MKATSKVRGHLQPDHHSRSNTTNLEAISNKDMYDQHSQALPPTCPFRDRLKKALRLIRDLVYYTIDLRLVPKHSTHTDDPRSEHQLQHPRMLLPRRRLNSLEI
ncbi:hypothetical protein BJX70DRAFT_376196 [Aspergillus crustosus]